MTYIYIYDVHIYLGQITLIDVFFQQCNEYRKKGEKEEEEEYRTHNFVKSIFVFQHFFSLNRLWKNP